MKKMLITMICALAVVASFIGCQVYDSQTNAVLETWMNKNGSDFQSYEEFAADFNDACANFRKSSTDEKAYDKIAEIYLGFDKFYDSALTAVKTVISAEKAVEICDATTDAVAQGKTDEEIEIIVAGIEEKYAKANNVNLHDVDWVVKKYKTSYFTKSFVTTNIISKIDTKKSDWTKISVEACAGTEFSLAGLFEDVYKLRWDYNSKK